MFLNIFSNISGMVISCLSLVFQLVVDLMVEDLQPLPGPQSAANKLQSLTVSTFVQVVLIWIQFKFQYLAWFDLIWNHWRVLDLV